LPIPVQRIIAHEKPSLHSFVYRHFVFGFECSRMDQHSNDSKFSPFCENRLLYSFRLCAACRSAWAAWTGNETCANFYHKGMEKHGYGPMTFAFEWDSPDRMKIYEVQGKKRQSEYGRNDGGVVRNEVREALRAQGVNIDQEVIVIL